MQKKNHFFKILKCASTLTVIDSRSRVVRSAVLNLEWDNETCPRLRCRVRPLEPIQSDRDRVVTTEWATVTHLGSHWFRVHAEKFSKQTPNIKRKKKHCCYGFSYHWRLFYDCAGIYYCNHFEIFVSASLRKLLQNRSKRETEASIETQSAIFRR